MGLSNINVRVEFLATRTDDSGSVSQTETRGSDKHKAKGSSDRHKVKLAWLI